MKETKMAHLRYHMQEAYYSKENRHPQEVMSVLGINYQHSTPQSICDQWWFWNCENIPQDLPKYLKKIDLNPMEYIGFGLSEEKAIAIRDYKNEIFN